MSIMDIHVAAIDGALREWLEQRAERGQDRFDEVWNGVLHVAPAERPINGYATAQLVRLLASEATDAGLLGLTATNVGHARDYRVPDALWVERDTDLVGLTYLPTARVVLETLSPGEEWTIKAAWYAAHGIRHLLLADPDQRTFLSMHFAGAAGWTSQTHVFSALGLRCADVEATLDWR